MRNRFIKSVVAIVVFAFAFTAFAELAAAAAQRPILYPINGKPREYFEPVPYNTTYNPRDFSGYWFRVGGARGHAPELAHPELTPEGWERMKTHKPSRTYLPEIVPAMTDPVASNYPALTCNPKGFPAIVVDDNHDHHEVVQLPSRILQLWQEERIPREIWLDGRELPSGDDYANIGVGWLGMSVGHWEGNTLVVETIGLDNRAWLDTFAFPKSDEARFIERYTLTDPETLEMEMTLYDPVYYTEPWISDIKVWRKEAQDARPINNFGWHGLFSPLNDLLCAPSNGGGRPSNPYGGD